MGMGDKIEAGMDKAVGKAKEAAGKATDNAEMIAEGKMDQAKGEMKSAGEKAKDSVQDAFDKQERSRRPSPGFDRGRDSRVWQRVHLKT